MIKIEEIVKEMMAYDCENPKRIEHFSKVHGFVKIIGTREKLSEKQQYIAEIAAIVHDIGIKVSEQKYGSCAGNYQEIEGPALAEKLLTDLHVEKDVIERVCYLVGHHHTYDNIEGLDYQILVEADLLVNMAENDMDAAKIKRIKEQVFKTKTGLAIWENIYGPC